MLCCINIGTAQVMKCHSIVGSWWSTKVHGPTGIWYGRYCTKTGFFMLHKVLVQGGHIHITVLYIYICIQFRIYYYMEGEILSWEWRLLNPPNYAMKLYTFSTSLQVVYFMAHFREIRSFHVANNIYSPYKMVLHVHYFCLFIALALCPFYTQHCHCTPKV